MSFWPVEGGVRGPQDLEDLVTASWLAETVFAALELRVFEALGEDDLTVDEAAERCGTNRVAFERLAQALSALGLLSLQGDRVACAAVARRHLLPGRPGYLGHSLAYRRRLSRTWSRLGEAVRTGASPASPPADEGEEDYTLRVRAYLLAMDDVARHKANLIADRLDLVAIRNPAVLDLGGGAGAIAAELLRRDGKRTAVVADLPEVVREARRLWTERGEADGPDGRLAWAPGDLLTSPLPAPPGGLPGWGLIIASNIVHAYEAGESGALLDAAADGLADDGLLVIHDFWTDGPGRGPLKAALFDLHMLLHTYQGRAYPWQWARDRLASRGLRTAGPIPLGERPGAEEDTGLMVAAKSEAAIRTLRADRLELLAGVARDLGFVRTAPLSPTEVVTGDWVRMKCRFGCANFDRGGQCPPRSPSPADTRRTMSGYGRALLVQGEPPSAEFHRRMLALEREAFLRGAHAALAYVAGPCRACPECAPDVCRHPDLARPSLEACGVDVYATARAAGWSLTPVQDRESPATYLGLVLVD